MKKSDRGYGSADGVLCMCYLSPLHMCDLSPDPACDASHVPPGAEGRVGVRGTAAEVGAGLGTGAGPGAEAGAVLEAEVAGEFSMLVRAVRNNKKCSTYVGACTSVGAVWSFCAAMRQALQETCHMR